MIALGQLDDRRFKRRFRMSRMSFEALLATIRHDLERNEGMATRSSGEPVYPYLQLAIALRYLAGGSYLDIADCYKVSVRVGNSDCCFHNVMRHAGSRIDGHGNCLAWYVCARSLVFCVTCFLQSSTPSIRMYRMLCFH
jgi:hypothetical protein